MSDESCPAIVCSIAAQSQALRANGPMRSREKLRGTESEIGTLPNVGIRPDIPQNAAGILMLPPVSLPIPPRNSPAAIPFAVPELDPPGHLAKSHGFRGIGKGFVGSGIPIANSLVVVFPIMTAPASFSLFITGPSRLFPQDGSRTKL